MKDLKNLENYIIDSNVKLNMNNYNQTVLYTGKIHLPTLVAYSNRLRIPIITLIKETFIFGLKEVNPNWKVINPKIQIASPEQSDNNKTIDGYCNLKIEFDSYNSQLINSMYLNDINLNDILFKGVKFILGKYSDISDVYTTSEAEALFDEYEVRDDDNDRKLNLHSIIFNSVKVALNKITTYLKNKQIKYSIKLVDSPNEQLILVNILFNDNGFEYDAKTYLDNIKYGIEKEFMISDLPIVFDISPKIEEKSFKNEILLESL